MAVRKAEAVWEGTLREGKGKMTLGSGAFDGPFSYSTRFEETPGSNPEELLGAAEAGCFSMALSAALERAGFPVVRVHTSARVYLEKTDAGMTITRMALTCEASVPGVEPAVFQENVEATRTGCIVARALTGVEITVDARLV
jgi:lipoyl-dependent peroxiredoxin